MQLVLLDLNGSKPPQMLLCKIMSHRVRLEALGSEYRDPDCGS